MPLPPPWLLLLLLLQQTCCSASACKELTCFADYLQTLMCTLGEGLCPRRAALYNLTAKWNCGEGGTCHFLPTSGNATPTQFTCLAEQKLCFGDNTFDVMVTEAADEPPVAPKGCRKTFVFKENIKPQPPFHLTAVVSPSGYNVSWETPYQHQLYNPLNGRLHYELRYRKRGHAWQGQKHLLQDARALWLLPQEFEGDTEYEVQVRARPEPFHRGAWSTWSAAATLATLPKTSDSQGDHGGTSRWLVLLSLFPALLAFLGQRLWKKLDLFVPSPAPFFQPLYVGHKGDFKKWVGDPRAGATLEVLERGPGVGPEAFGTGSFKLFPLSPGVAECRGTGGAGQADPITTPSVPQPAAQSNEGAVQEQPYGRLSIDEGAAQEQPYGRLSIDTVTVAGGVVPCCPQCDRYAGVRCAAQQQQQQEEAEEEWEEAGTRDTDHRIHCEGAGGGWDGQVPGAALRAENLIPPSASSCLSPSLPPSQQVGDSLGRGPGEGALFFFGPPFPTPDPPPSGRCHLSLGSLSTPEGETPFYSTLLSLHLETEDEGDPENGLDLDTIDSGFADCDCGSPLDSDCETRPTGDMGGEEKEAFLPSYVKQWVSGHSLKA